MAAFVEFEPGRWINTSAIIVMDYKRDETTDITPGNTLLGIETVSHSLTLTMVGGEPVGPITKVAVIQQIADAIDLPELMAKKP